MTRNELRACWRPGALAGGIFSQLQGDYRGVHKPGCWRQGVVAVAGEFVVLSHSLTLSPRQERI